MAELHGQIRCFPYIELSDVPRLQQVEERKNRRTAEESRTNQGTVLGPLLF
jgi:hypothetical protein